MKDIFGKALFSYWEGDRKTPYIVRRNDDYNDESSLKIHFTKQLYPTEKIVAHHVNGKILDVGCGAGRHILHYQNRGSDTNLQSKGKDLDIRIKNPVKASD